MIDIEGRFASAKIFTEHIDKNALDQIRTLCDMPFVQGSRIRIMPDVHAGAGCAIGTTMTITDSVVPNLVGVDIGCGMLTAEILEKDLDFPALDRLIRDKIPSGTRVRQSPHPFLDQIRLEDLRCAGRVDLHRARLSLGTLGGGNHFIEAGRDEEDRLFIVIHSGSRKIGLEAANLYQRLAAQAVLKGEKQQGAKSGKKGRRGQSRPARADRIPSSLSPVTGSLFHDYIHDMRILQRYALLNRQAMMDEIVKGLSLQVTHTFNTIHNYIDTEDMILRKGAVSAQKGEQLLIPINMRDGSLLCRGKGNPDWNFSAPHGAGRLYSRSAAKATFRLEDFRSEMEGIYSSTVDRDTLDECPMAYKPMELIVRGITPTAEVLSVIRPLYNFKAGRD